MESTIESTASYSGQESEQQEDEEELSAQEESAEQESPEHQGRVPNPAKNKKSMRFNAEFYNMRK